MNLKRMNEAILLKRTRVCFFSFYNAVGLLAI